MYTNWLAVRLFNEVVESQDLLIDTKFCHLKSRYTVYLSDYSKTFAIAVRGLLTKSVGEFVGARAGGFFASIRYLPGSLSEYNKRQRWARYSFITLLKIPLKSGTFPRLAGEKMFPVILGNFTIYFSDVV